MEALSVAPRSTGTSLGNSSGSAGAGTPLVALSAGLGSLSVLPQPSDTAVSAMSATRSALFTIECRPGNTRPVRVPWRHDDIGTSGLAAAARAHASLAGRRARLSDS